MSHPRCSAAARDDRRSVSNPASQTVSTRPRRSRVSQELIDQVHQLMERSIEFVPHPEFDAPDPLISLRKLRPESINHEPVRSRAEPGLVFVSGLVKAPLLTPEEEKYWFIWMNFLKFRAERNRRRLDLSRPDRQLVERIQADLAEALSVRNHIVEGNLRLIVALAKKLTASLDHMAELISEGMPPLIRSVELFDISLGNRFSTYATWAVRNQMLRLLKRMRTSLETEPGEDAPSLENLPDWRTSSNSTEAAQELRIDAVRRLLAGLSDRERQIVAARFALEGQPNGQSLADIAERMGLSKERVRQIALNSISKLRESMTYDEFEAMS